MNINKQYAWQSSNSNCIGENSPLLPRNVRGLGIGKSGCGKTTVIFNLLLQLNWLDYNHLYVFGKSRHQQEYNVLRKGFEAGLSKQQISNVFANQEALHAANVSPLTAIDKEFKQFCHGVWSCAHNFLTIDLASAPMNGKYR